MEKEVLIQTVLGPVSPEELGHCQVHEHIFVEDTPAARVHPKLRFDDREKSRQELVLYKEAGGTAIVDAQPVDAGRNAQVLVELSERTGVTIVASTGYHLDQYYMDPVDRSEGQWYEKFCAELTQNLEYDSGRLEARAGIVKAAIPAEGPVGGYEKKLKAAARAAADCGVSLLMHTEAGQCARQAVELCTGQGLAPDRIILCHIDWKVDRAVHRAVAELGTFLEYDSISNPSRHSNEEEIALIVDMLNVGCEDRLLLSLDTTRARLRSYGGTIGMDHLLRDFLPRLQECGLSEEMIHKITRINPVRALSGQAPVWTHLEEKRV